MNAPRATICRVSVLLLMAALAAGIHFASLTKAGVAGATPDAAASTAAAPITPISLAEAKVLDDAGEAQIIDAREAADYRAGHILGARHLPPSAFAAGRPAKLDTILPAVTTLIYCSATGADTPDSKATADSADCPAAEIVARQLQRFGFSDVRVIEGGYEAWQATGHPTDTAEDW